MSSHRSAPTFSVGSLRVHVVRDARGAAREMADELAMVIDDARAGSKHPVLGLAAGRTPRALYDEIVSRVAAAEMDWSDVECFHLDEYVGLPPDHPSSFRASMSRDLHARLDSPADRIHFPVRPDHLGDARDACRAYEERIARAGGIDWQLLGIGRNGHVAFNEPGSAADSRTREVVLSIVTREANRADFANAADVPTRAVTMGVATIRAARRLRWMAFGEGKAEIVREWLESPPSPSLPASLLRDHTDGALWIDADAASALSIG